MQLKLIYIPLMYIKTHIHSPSLVYEMNLHSTNAYIKTVPSAPQQLLQKIFTFH